MNEKDEFGGIRTPVMEDLPPPAVVEGALVTPNEDGSVDVSLDGDEDVSDVEIPFDGNLALKLSERRLDEIAQQVIDWVTTDRQSRADWLQRLEAGATTLGIGGAPMTGMSIKGASRVQHPLIAEAVVQFQARAVAELIPPGGPAKGIVLGQASPELEAQADRVAMYINYRLMEKDRGYFHDTDQMLMKLPLFGSQFRKTAPDPVTLQIRTRTADSLDFIVPYTATSLEDSPRYTHVLPRTHINDLKKSIANGFYREVDLEMGVSMAESTPGTDLQDASDDKVNTSTDDDTRSIYECHCSLSIDCDQAEFTDAFDLPYIVSVESSSMKVLAIRRNWDDGDPTFTKKIYFSHYKYLPGLGFYGLGLLHIIGDLGVAATGVLRAILDSAARANFSGGFRSKEARSASDSTPGLGEWIDVDLSWEDLSKAFFPLPYKEPGTGIFAALTNIQDLGQRFASTTEAMVGEAGNSGPVGTTLALIEQAGKVFSGVHKRTHVSMREELAIYTKFIGDGFTGTSYPYKMAGVDAKVLLTDFDGRVDVAPISDPTLSSSTQRIAQAQAVVQLQQTAPGLYGKQAQKAAHAKLLKAMQVPDVEIKAFMQDDPPPEQPPPTDPVTEGSALISGKPVKAYPEQDHGAHIQMHMELIDLLPKEMVKKAIPAIEAHIAEHVALQYARMMQARAMQEEATRAKEEQAMEAIRIKSDEYLSSVEMVGRGDKDGSPAKAS